MRAKTWILLVMAAMAHVLSVCCVNDLCGLITCLQANIGSAAFTIGVSMILSRYPIYPCTENRPPKVILYTYYAFMSVLVTMLSLRLVWIPFTDKVVEVNHLVAKMASLSYINRLLKLHKKSKLKKMAEFMETKCAQTWTVDLVGVWFMLYAIDSGRMFFDISDSIKEFFGSIKDYFSDALCPRKCVSFNEEISVQLYDPAQMLLDADD